MKQESVDRLNEAKTYLEVEDWPSAMKLVNKVLDDEPDSSAALYYMGYILYHTERLGLAQVVLEKSLNLDPNHTEVWNLYGRCFQEGHDLERAESAFSKSLAIDPRNWKSLSNLGLIYVNRSNPKRALQYINKALLLAPDDPETLHNKSLCYLMLHEWEKGFDIYDTVLGRVESRTERAYRNPLEPRFNGEKGLNVIAYGEQGLGDEITFASCIPDLIEDSKQVIIDCDRRLENLFKRSFPKAIVHGDRYATDLPWLHDHEIDARVAFGSLPKFYRKNGGFPGTPYLIPDPERKIQWKALLDALGDDLKIGVAWTAGRKETGRERRSMPLEALLPVLKEKATFISLEYLDPSDEIKAFEEKHGIKIHHWPRAVELSQDYDETAALVSELDLVIGVPTTVLHLAGALGVPFIAMAPEWPTWMWHGDYPWANDNLIVRKKDSWKKVAQKVARHVKDFHRNGPEAASGVFGSAKLNQPVRKEA